MRKIISTGIRNKKSFAIRDHFQRMGIIFFILSLPSASFSQQTERASTIEGQLIKSIPSLKDFNPGLISLQTSLTKNRKFPSLDDLSAKLIDYGTKAKGDPVVQRVSSTSELSLQETSTLTGIPSTVEKNFDGLSVTNLTPASPSIAAGPNHIIQMINGPTGSHFKIWDRDGNVVIGQTILSSLFSGGGYTGEFDPIAIYDQFADRYMMTELGTVGGSILVNTLVIAISQTNDPTGGWNLYKFTDNSFYHSYPHFAAWPNALYATTNDYSYNGSFYTFLGSSIYAIDKNEMVAGNLTVPLIRRRISPINGDNKIISIGPVNISGTTPPAAGSPGMFMYFSDDNFTSSSTDADSVGFISLQPDFATPANSVTSFFQQIAVAPFKSGLCNNFKNCIPAPGGQYETVSDRFMHRIYYRNFGTHESIVANHTVDANYPALPQRAGVRWYEFRSTGGAWSTYQQGTYSPDAQSRWMGSIGINSKGQIALSYNLASPVKFGSFYFTGRNSGDVLNQMSIADNAIINGTGYGTFSNRWGAYNDMATDIVNDSLFWTTAMYGHTFTTWKTRVAAIKIGDPPPLTVTINQAASQADPTTLDPVHFTVEFDQDVTGFDASDISFTGSTASGTLVATVTGGPAVYDVSVSGMTSSGTVVASIPAGAAVNNNNQSSLASTSTDNTVGFIVIPHDLVVIKQASAPAVLAGGVLIYPITIHNNAPGVIQGVTFIDVLPSGVVFLNIQSFTGSGILAQPLLSAPPAGQNGTVSFYFPALAPGAHITFAIVVGVSANTTGTLTNTATLSGPPGETNPANNSSIVNVQIVVPPTITCPANVSVTTGTTDCIGSVDLGNLTYVTTGTPAPELSLSWRNNDDPLSTLVALTVVPGTETIRTFPRGITTITAKASNGVFPDATCQFTITVADQIPPIITCPANVDVKAEAGVCTAVVSSATIGTATATDNCFGALTITHSAFPAGNVFPVGTTNITWTATDASGITSTCVQTITVGDDQVPVIENISVEPAILWPPNHKMKDVEIRYSSRDNCGAVSCRLEVSSSEPINGTGDGDTSPDWVIVDEHHVKLRAERAANGDRRIYTITIVCSDAQGNDTRKTESVVVAHNITAPHSGQSFKVGSTVSFAGTFWDKPGNTHSAKWLIDGSTSVKGIVVEPSGHSNGKVTGSYKFTTPGVYKLQMNTTDQNGLTSYTNTNGDLEAIVVIYDPNGGHTYGGGYYHSPAGALKSNPAATGKASYGFAINYFKNSTYPKGETQFEFKVGEFEFNALNFEYLVISNSMSQFKGTGKIIGGQSGVGFTMTVVDGQLDGSGVDKIRMKIYNKNTGKIIYDNQPGASDAALPIQAVGANSIIVIQRNLEVPSSSNGQEVTESNMINGLEVVVQPNPASRYFNLTINSSNAKEKIVLLVYDMQGRLKEVRNNIATGSTISLGNLYRPGAYFVRVLQGNQHKELKLVKISD